MSPLSQHEAEIEKSQIYEELQFFGIDSDVLLFPAVSQDTDRQGPIQCRERLGGLLKYYTREAA